MIMGSIARDQAERNVNSVNFPEFHQEAQNADKDVSEEGIKQALFEIAEYEREWLGLAKGKLEKSVPKRVSDDVTDLFGQIYVARDIASRMR